MNATFDKLYRQLGRVTFGVLLATLAVYGLALGCALLGFREAVISFMSVTYSLAYVFGVLVSVFLVGSIVRAVIQWIDRRDGVKGR
jgi:hypothetical protein